MPGIGPFDSPYALFFLLLIPVYLLWYIFYFHPRRLVIKLSYDPHTVYKPKLSASFLRWVPKILFLSGLVAMIIALARPQSSSDIIERQAEGVDIMLLLDASESMETPDFFPDRLSAAKATANSFVEGRKEDRIGIILFAEEALGYVPLTLDYSYLNRMIRVIRPGILPKQGTAIGAAIGTGINHMKESEASSKVMVLLTDGTHNRGKIDPISAAKLAKQHGIKIYCIGIGKETYEQVDMLGNRDTLQGDLDPVTLQRIAQISDGIYFHGETREALYKIFNQISEMETSQIQERVFREVSDHYPIFIQVGLVLWALSFVSMFTFMHNPLEL